MGDDRVADQRTQRRPAPARRFGAGDAEVVPFRHERESVAMRLERQWAEEERAERERRARIERQRTARDRVIEERLERRRRERLQRLRQERANRYRRERYVWSARKREGAAAPKPAERKRPEPAQRTPPEQRRARVDPAVRGPVRKRERAAENRRRAATRRRGLFWPTAKVGFAVTVVLGMSAGLGSMLGLPVPGPDSGSGGQSLASSATLFGIDAGTPPGLAKGYVFPLIGPHDFGDKIARFGAPRSGHTHEGQDIFGKVGTPEVAVHDGIVVDRGKATDPDDGGRGNYIAIYSAQDDRSFVYMHMLKPPIVQLGDQVHAGQLLGRLGCTGTCDGPHLHFEVRIGKASLGAETKPLDPLPYLRGWPQATPG